MRSRHDVRFHLRQLNCRGFPLSLLKSPDNKGIISLINDYLLFVIEADNITDLDWISKLLMIRERFVENRQ